MLWDSVIEGLKVLLYWETYVAGLEYLLIFMGPMFLLGALMDRGGEESGLLGCLGMFGLPILQVAAIAVFILTLSPIILGFGEDAVWSFPWQVIIQAPGSFFKLIGILIISAILLAFIPFIGQIQSLQTLVLGGIALVFVLGILNSIDTDLVPSEMDLLPGFWFTLGLLIAGAILGWIGIMAAAGIGVLVKGLPEKLAPLLLFPIAAIFGFLPVFIYGAWLGRQL